MVIEEIQFFNYINLLPTYFSSNFMFNLFNIVCWSSVNILGNNFIVLSLKAYSTIFILSKHSKIYFCGNRLSSLKLFHIWNIILYASIHTNTCPRVLRSFRTYIAPILFSCFNGKSSILTTLPHFKNF